MDSKDSIIKGIDAFKAKHGLNWDELIAVSCGDIVVSLAKQKVLYSEFQPDYIVFEPTSVEEACEIISSLRSNGVKIRYDQCFSDNIFLYLFCPRIAKPNTPFHEIAPSDGWTPPFPNHQRVPSSATPGEMTPFIFKDKLYRLTNFRRDLGNGEVELGCEIRRESDDAVISTPWTGHYYSIAFIWDNKCWCFGKDYSNGMKISLTVSEDLISWSEPKTVLDLTASKINLYNCYVAFDGKRFVMAYECNAPDYPIFTLKFVESQDLYNWCEIKAAIYGADKYIGGPSLYYMDDGYYYVTYVDQFVHPIDRKLNYQTLITRSKDLINWEDAPTGRPVLAPKYKNRPMIENAPETYELNTSDAEFIELDGKVRVYFNGGNQLGVTDNQYAECDGSLKELFQSFFDSSTN